MTTKRAILYARVSTDDTRKDNLNLDGQIKMCRDYAIERSYNVIHELTEDDRGASGAETNLLQLNKIRDLAARQKFDVLIIREIDRLSRKLAKQLIIEDELKRYNVEIEYVLAQYENSLEEMLNKNIRAVVAEYEREKIRERLYRGKRNKANAGSVVTSSVRPFGYQIETDAHGKRVLVIDEFEAKIVCDVFDWYLSGMSITAITKKLTELRIPTVHDTIKRSFKRRKYGHWYETSVSKILKYDTYATGLWIFGRTKTITTPDGKKRQIETPEDDPNRIYIPVPKIISQNIFDKVQKQRAINAKLNDRGTKNNYLIGRRVICGNCENAVTARTAIYKYKTKTTKYTYYLCGASKKNRRVEQCENRFNFRGETVDKTVWNFIKRLVKDPDFVKQKLLDQMREEEEKTGPIRRAIETTDGLIEKHSKHLAALTKSLVLVVESEQASEAIAKQIKDEQQTIDSLKTEKAELQAKLDSVITITPLYLTSTINLARTLKDEIDHIHDFETQRGIIEQFNIQVTLWKEDDKRMIKIECYLGAEILRIDPTSS